MLLKVRVRRYNYDDFKAIQAAMLEYGIAQNTSANSPYIEGDYVDDHIGHFLGQCKILAERFKCSVEVVLAE